MAINLNPKQPNVTQNMLSLLSGITLMFVVFSDHKSYSSHTLQKKRIDFPTVPPYQVRMDDALWEGRVMSLSILHFGVSCL